MIDIRSLDGISFERLYKAFESAFADYEINVDRTELKSMLKRRGFEPSLSFAAFSGDDIVAFTFNGVGPSYNGRLTAYDTGTGTIKEFRGRRLAGKIFSHSIPLLKNAGVEYYLLEVLRHNESALRIYENLGFEILREFDFFSQTKHLVDRNFSHGSVDCAIVPLQTDDIMAAQSFLDFRPSWQNDIQSIKRAGNDLVKLGATVDSVLAGFCVFSPKSGDITQIAVAPPFRRQGIASSLLKRALEMIEYESVKVINVESPSPALDAFLASKGIPLAGKQYEMILTL